jgi:hypothetical protein
MAPTATRVAVAGLLAAGLTLAGAGTSSADPYTRQFTGEGSSSFGFAWDYARAQARAKAVADGFTDPAAQCAEIWAWGDVFWARVVWECTREV